MLLVIPEVCAPCLVLRDFSRYLVWCHRGGDVSRRYAPSGRCTRHDAYAAGRILTVTAPDGGLTTYTYDPAGNLLTRRDDNGHVTSNLTLTTLPSTNGHKETRVYDNAGRLIELKNERISPAQLRDRFLITLDAVGNPTRIDRTGALSQSQTYTYDASDRLLTVCFLASCVPSAPERIAWTYDKVGNRLTETRSSGTTNYAYDDRDRLLSAGATSYTYDQNGNQLSAGAQPFTYDLANRLKTTTQGTTTTTYSYDGDGKRLQASTGTANSAKTNFLWDVSHSLPQLAQERNGGNTLQRQYVYGLERIRQTQGTGTYYLYDGLGSVSNTTAPLGALQKTYSYEPYGLIRTESGSSPTNFFHFTGEYRDPTGLYHLRARQYDPGTGRFLRPDPVDPGVGSPLVSSYAYAANRPTTLVDPSGERFRPVLTARALAEFSTARVSPTIVYPGGGGSCHVAVCGGRYSLVHPIPAGYPGGHGGKHPTGGKDDPDTRRWEYAAYDFFPGSGTPVLAVENGEIYRRTGNHPSVAEKFKDGRWTGVWGWNLYLKGKSGTDYFYTHLGTRIGIGPVRAGD